MKKSIDNQIARLLSSDTAKAVDCLGEGEVSFSWPSLLEYLGMGQLLSSLPSFDKESNLFIASISALSEVENTEDVFYIYDSLFTVVLKALKALAEISPAFLLEKIEEKKGKGALLDAFLLSNEKRLKENPTEAIHNLVLYLAWDRMCIYIARLFDCQCQEPRFIENLKKLKDCLIESYQHIAHQGTTPSFYRMVEALFYYQMREEQLALHNEAEWKLLNQSFAVLKDSNELSDVFYIDNAVILDSQQEEELYHVTFDPPEIVQCRLALAHYMMAKIQKETPEWHYTLTPSRIIHL